MIYSIQKNGNAFVVNAKGVEVEVTGDFLKSQMKDYKFAELIRDGYATVRGNWDLSQFGAPLSLAPAATVKSQKDAPVQETKEPFKKKFYEGGEYVVEANHRYEGLYELWYRCPYGYYKFAVYLFDLESVPVLINEHRKWLKFDKKITRDMCIDRLGVPDDKKFEEDDI